MNIYDIKSQQRSRRCYNCDGTGYGMEMGEEDCWECCGTGRFK